MSFFGLITLKFFVFFVYFLDETLFSRTNEKLSHQSLSADNYRCMIFVRGNEKIVFNNYGKEL